MIAIMFVGLSTHLQGGMTVWRLATTTTAAQQRERVAFERLGRDLANAFVYDAREGIEPAARFNAHALQWFTVAARSAAGVPAVRLVTYECRQTGETAGLWRTSQSVSEARAGREPVSELVLPACDALSIRYAYLPEASGGGGAPLTWLPEWQRGTAGDLPRLLEASAHLASGRTIQRILAIPVGALKAHQAS